MPFLFHRSSEVFSPCQEKYFETDGNISFRIDQSIILYLTTNVKLLGSK